VTGAFFADLAALRAWERSPERQELAAQAEALATGEARQELTGMEAWFDLPPAAAPPRHVMALLTLAAIWPLVSVPRGRRRSGRARSTMGSSPRHRRPNRLR
jgi:antibiotic biosynthesis monooxygenase (ABM) superfamily enzyme